MPHAATLPVCSINARAACVTRAIASSAPRAGSVAMVALAHGAPAASATPSLTEVPPRSMPRNRSDGNVGANGEHGTGTDCNDERAARTAQATTERKARAGDYGTR